jgi:hypothetical protein
VKFGVEITVGVNQSDLAQSEKAYKRLGLGAEDAQKRVKELATSTDEGSKQMRSSTIATAAAFERFAKGVDAGGRGSELALTKLRVKVDELKAHIEATRRAGAPVSPDALATLKAVESQTDSYVRKLGSLRAEQDDVRKMVNASQASFDGQLRAITSVEDAFEQLGGKMGKNVLLGFALWESFKTGYDIGTKLRDGINMLERELFGTTGTIDKIVKSTSQFQIGQMALNRAIVGGADDLSKYNEYLAARARLQAALEKRPVVTSAPRTDPFQGLLVGQRTDEEWKRVLDEQLATRKKITDEARRLAEQQAKALADAARHVSILQQQLRLVQQGMDPARARELVAAAERLGKSSLLDPLVKRLAESVHQGKLLEAGLAHGDNLIKSMAAGAALVAKNLAAAAKGSAKITLYGKGEPGDSEKGDHKKQVDDFVKEWNRGWMSYRDYGRAAIDETAASLKSAIVAGATGSGDAWKQMWEGMTRTGLSIFLDMLEQMLRRWIATQAAMAATDYATKSGGAKNIGKGGGAGGASQVAGAGAAAAGSGMSSNQFFQYAAVAYALFVVYKAFIEDHKRKFSSVTLGSSGSIESVAGHGKKYLAGVQQAAAELLKTLTDWMREVDVQLKSFASVTIESSSAGFMVSAGAQIIGTFRSAEEAISAAQAFMVRFGEFASDVPNLVQAAIRGTREFDMSAITSNVAFARTLLTQNMEQVARAMQEATQLFVDQMRRSLDLFASTGAAFNAAALTEATGSALLHFTNSLHELYNQLTGHRDDPKEAAERQRVAYNAQRAIVIAQITLLIEEVKARIAAMQIHALYIQRVLGNVGGPAGGADPGRDRNDVGGGRSKGGGAYIEDSRNPGNDPQMAAMLRVLDDLVRALAGIDPEIGAGGVKPHGGGGQRGSDRQQLRDEVADMRRRRELAAMGDAQRSVAEFNDRFKELRELAHGNAAALAELNTERLAELKALAEQVRQRGAAYLPSSQGGTLDLTQWQQQAQAARKMVEDLVKANADLVAAGGQAAFSQQQLADIERNALAKVAEDAIASLGLPLEQARAHMKAVGDAIDFVKKQADDGVISQQRYADVIAQVAAQGNSELLGLAHGLLQAIGDDKTAAAVKHALDVANFIVQREQLRILIAGWRAAGIVISKVLEDAFGIIDAFDPSKLPGLEEGGAGIAEHMAAANDNAIGIRDALFEALKRLKQWTDSLLLNENLTVLSPQAQNDEARRQLAAAYAAATRTHTPESIQEFMRIADQVLQTFRRNEASGALYQQIFALVLQMSRQLQGLPQYAEGGYTGSRKHLAWLHPHEVVVPLSRRQPPPAASAGRAGAIAEERRERAVMAGAIDRLERRISALSELAPEINRLSRVIGDRDRNETQKRAG